MVEEFTPSEAIQQEAQSTKKPIRLPAYHEVHLLLPTEEEQQQAFRLFPMSVEQQQAIEDSGGDLTDYVIDSRWIPLDSLTEEQEVFANEHLWHMVNYDENGKDMRRKEEDD